jgi:hypothetical protein
MLRFDPPTLKQELSKALELISEKTSGLYTAADFGDLIDVNDPDFDPELLDDEVITPDTIVRFAPRRYNFFQHFVPRRDRAALKCAPSKNRLRVEILSYAKCGLCTGRPKIRRLTRTSKQTSGRSQNGGNRGRSRSPYDSARVRSDGFWRLRRA